MRSKSGLWVNKKQKVTMETRQIVLKDPLSNLHLKEITFLQKIAKQTKNVRNLQIWFLGLSGFEPLTLRLSNAYSTN